MTTYQDIVDYLDEDYDGWYKVSSNEPPYITISNGYDKTNIYKDRYNSSLDINSKLNRLLADLLDTPVDKRVKPIEHKVEPVTNSANLVPNLLTTVDQVVQDINSFIVRTKHNASEWIMFINTDLSIAKLNEIFKLYSDYNIKIYNHRNLSPEYDLLIEPK